MTTEEKTTEKDSETIQKSEDSVTSLLASVLKKQDERLDNQEETFGKRFEALENLIKEQNKNPVDQGIEAENKPKVEDAKDVGDKVTIGNEVAPKPSEAQASIIAPAVDDSKKDQDGLKMENKADDEDDKKEEKKEDVKKDDDNDDKKDDKKEDVKKSDELEYEIVKTIRPQGLNSRNPENKSVPTGYQVIKAAISGWGGKTSSAEEALTIMYQKEARGEFGNGQPSYQGAY